MLLYFIIRRRSFPWEWAPTEFKQFMKVSIMGGHRQMLKALYLKIFCGRCASKPPQKASSIKLSSGNWIYPHPPTNIHTQQKCSAASGWAVLTKSWNFIAPKKVYFSYTTQRLLKRFVITPQFSLKIRCWSLNINSCSNADDTTRISQPR